MIKPYWWVIINHDCWRMNHSQPSLSFSHGDAIANQRAGTEGPHRQARHPPARHGSSKTAGWEIRWFLHSSKSALPQWLNDSSLTVDYFNVHQSLDITEMKPIEWSTCTMYTPFTGKFNHEKCHNLRWLGGTRVPGPTPRGQAKPLLGDLLGFRVITTLEIQFIHSCGLHSLIISIYCICTCVFV